MDCFVEDTNPNLEGETGAAWFRLLLDGLTFEPKSDRSMYLLSQRWLSQRAQRCCRGWLLPGPAAQAQLSPSFCLWLCPAGVIETESRNCFWRYQADCLATVFLVLQSAGEESRGVLLLLNRSVQLQMSKCPTLSRKKMQGKGGESVSPTAHQQKVGRAMFSLWCPCTWCR